MSEHIGTEILELKTSNNAESFMYAEKSFRSDASNESINIKWIQALESFVNSRQAVDTVRSRKSSGAQSLQRAGSGSHRTDRPLSIHNLERELIQSKQIKDFERQVFFLSQENEEAQHFSAKFRRRVTVLETEVQDLSRQLELEENMTTFLKTELATATENLRESRIINQKLTVKLHNVEREAECRTDWLDLSYETSINSAEQDQRISQQASIKRMENAITNLKSENQSLLVREIELEDALKMSDKKLREKDNKLRKKCRDVQNLNETLEEEFKTSNVLREENKAWEIQMLSLRSEILQAKKRCSKLSEKVECLQHKLREKSLWTVNRVSSTNDFPGISLRDEVEEKVVHSVSSSISTFSHDNDKRNIGQSTLGSKCTNHKKRPWEQISWPASEAAFPNLVPLASQRLACLSRPSYEIPFSNIPLSLSSYRSSKKKSNNSAINFIWSYRTLAWSSALLCILATFYYLSSKKISKVTARKTINQMNASEAVSVKLSVNKPEKLSSNKQVQRIFSVDEQLVLRSII